MPQTHCRTLKNHQKSPKFGKKQTKNEANQFIVSRPPFLADKREIEKNRETRNSRFRANHSLNLKGLLHTFWFTKTLFRIFTKIVMQNGGYLDFIDSNLFCMFQKIALQKCKKRQLWSAYPRLIESLAVFLGIIRVMTWTKKCPLKEETNFLSRK